MNKFLDEKGLGILWNKIKSEDKTISDKLSTTDNKVNGILNGDQPLVSPVITASW